MLQCHAFAGSFSPMVMDIHGTMAPTAMVTTPLGEFTLSQSLESCCDGVAAHQTHVVCKKDASGPRLLLKTMLAEGVSAQTSIVTLTMTAREAVISQCPKFFEMAIGSERRRAASRLTSYWVKHDRYLYGRRHKSHGGGEEEFCQRRSPNLPRTREEKLALGINVRFPVSCHRSGLRSMAIEFACPLQFCIVVCHISKKAS
ncbi:uncharacterized protein BDV17DRAFT_228777 [Aspergillus undulatus]|uniref:uncharacterized protein n=1 Tax=Aspergillus undulatus TaxID=1810928 RepID=UPI003CCD1A5A